MGRTCILLLSVIIAVIASIQFLPFYPELKPTARHFEPAPQLVGPLAPNKLLDSYEKLWHHIHGPESIEIHNGWIYTGTSDGNIHRLKGSIDEILIDRKCDDIEICNRPLGVRFLNSTQELYVADAYLGIYKVNVQTKKVETLFDALKPLGKEKVSVKFTDDLTVSSSGDVYFTDLCTSWPLREFHFSAVELRPDGRILHYSPATKTTKVLIDGLYSPNGIQLSPNEDSIIFSESWHYRLRRYYLNGPKKGILEIFANNLPGLPDNIRPSGRGTYWLGLFQSRYKNGGKSTIKDYLAPYPEFRSFLVRLPYFLILPLEILDSFGITHGAYELAKTVVREIMVEAAIISNYGLIIELDQNGKIIRSLHSPSGSIPSITQVTEYQSALYLGSVDKNGIHKVKL